MVVWEGEYVCRVAYLHRVGLSGGNCRHCWSTDSSGGGCCACSALSPGIFAPWSSPLKCPLHCGKRAAQRTGMPGLCIPVPAHFTAGSTSL